MPIALAHVAYQYITYTPSPSRVLSDISLTIADGEFVGIMGQTGSGKTTLIQLIAGLIAPTEGKILLDGDDINARGYDKGVLRRSVGLVFQYPEYQLFETSVEKDVAFGLKHSGLGKEEIKKNVQWAIETMGFSFEAIRSISPLALSGGEKRRIAIAGVLATKPKILILDEPVAGLDPPSRESFLHLLSQMNQRGTTIIMVSHNADAISAYATRMVILANGRIAADGQPSAVFADIAKMKKLRLDVSTPRMIAAMLSEKGFAINTNIVEYNELLSSLKTRLHGVATGGTTP